MARSVAARNGHEILAESRQYISLWGRARLIHLLHDVNRRFQHARTKILNWIFVAHKELQSIYALEKLLLSGVSATPFDGDRVLQSQGYERKQRFYSQTKDRCGGWYVNKVIEQAYENDA